MIRSPSAAWLPSCLLSIVCLAGCDRATPLPGAAAVADAGEHPGAPPFQIEHSAVHTLHSPQLQRSYDIYIKLPPGYAKAENAQRDYPVVYLNDGPYTFQVASGETRVPFNQGFFEEFILVGISYAQGEDAQVSRRRDMTTSVDPSKDSPTGGARTYFDFIKHEVLPFVERTYRVDRTRRTLAGQSYGGLFGMWVLFNEPDVFQNYILTSCSLWFGHRDMFVAEASYAAAHTDLKANVYLAVGEMETPRKSIHADEDMVGAQEAMLAQLHARKYPNLKLHARVIDGAYHVTTFPVGLLWGLQDLFMVRP